MEVKAPMVAKKIRPGQFVVLMTHEKGERIPMSVQKAENGNVTMFIRKLGKTSVYLISKEEDRFNIKKFGKNYKKYMEKVPRTNLLLGVMRRLRRRFPNH